MDGSLIISGVACAVGVAGFIVASQRQKKDDVERAISGAFGGYENLNEANAAQLDRYERRIARQDERIDELEKLNRTCEARCNEALHRVVQLERQLAERGVV